MNLHVHPLSGKVRKSLFQLLLVAALLLALLAGLHPEAWEPARLKTLILSFGALAPLAFILLYTVAVFIPYAASLMTVAAGLAFGTLWGGLLTYLVTLPASLLPMAVARHLGRAWVEQRIGRSRVRKLAELINRNAFLVFLYLRLLPTIPYEMQNYIAGVTRIRYREFLLASALGNAPAIFVMSFFGDSLTTPGSLAFWSAAGIYGVMLVLPVLVAVVRRRHGAHRGRAATASEDAAPDR